MSRKLKNAIGAIALAAAVAVSVSACQSKGSTSSAPVDAATNATGSAAGTTTGGATGAAATTAPAAASIGNGTLIVGKDIQPGTYKALATDAAGGYWERDKDTSGSADSILANDNVATGDQAVVTILPTDKSFKSTGMGGWVPADGPSLTGGKLGSGTLIVGIDIQPGTYTATVTDQAGGYWERATDTTGSTDSIAANDNVDYGNKATVTISAGDKAFKSTGFGPWVKD